MRDDTKAARQRAERQEGKVKGRRSKAEGRRQKVQGRRLEGHAASATFFSLRLKSLGFLNGTLSAPSPAMNQWREEMKRRTHAFAVDVVQFVQRIPDRSDTRRLKDQLVGAASGTDLNWHAACRGRTHKEFTSKLGVVQEEADEAAECLAVIRDTRLAQGDDLARLCQEGHELRLIFAKATRTANENEERANRMKRARTRQKGRG
jgi:four helix bundle protein